MSFWETRVLMEGSCIIRLLSLWKWDLSSKPLSDTMFGQALSFNLDKDKTHHRWRLCFDRNFSAIHMTVQLIFIFKDVRSLLKLQPHFHLRPGYSVHNWKIVCWRAAESMNQKAEGLAQKIVKESCSTAREKKAKFNYLSSFNSSCRRDG